MRYERIVTHGDFDGLVSAAICSRAEGVERFVFTGPNSIERSEISIDERDIVCDLPYPLECGVWFDHHPGNLEALKLRGVDPGSIEGRFEERPSCARVVFEFYGSKSGYSHPPHFAGTVDEADRIDSFDYRSIEEWREESPGKLVDMSLKAYFPGPREQTKYLSHLVPLLRDHPLGEIVQEPAVAANIERYRTEEARMSEFIGRSITFLPQDGGREIIVLDFTHHKRRPRVIKNLAYLHHPQALAVLTLNPLFRGGVKTNDFSVSMSLSMNLTGREHGKDIGEMMRTLGIGDGHIGAAAGKVRCATKEEMLRMKERMLSRIWGLWIGGADSN
jgi:hypothetical protein